MTLACWSATCGAEVGPAAAACPSCGSPLRIRDKYRIVCLLGQGGMGVVYEAEDETLGRRVALKIMHGRFEAQSGRRARFQTECRAMAALDHPGIARIYDADAHHDQLFFVQALIRGRPLRAYMTEWAAGAQGLSRAAAVASALELLDALEHAHEHGVVHRDINPNNVMIVERGGALHPVLVDFGLARTADQDATKVAWGGTPGYVAPEQILEPTSNDRRSDLYSVAALLHVLLTRGTPPYAEALEKGIGESPRALLAAYQRIASGAVPLAALSTHDPGVPPDLERAVSRALSPDPAARFQTAAEMIAALRPFALVQASAPELAPTMALPTNLLAPAEPPAAPRPQAPPRPEPSSPWGAGAPPSTISAVAGSTTANAGARTSSAEPSRASRVPLLIVALVLLIAGGAFLALRSTGDPPPSAAVPSASLSASATARPPVTGPPVRIGILHSQSGTMAISERPVVDATRLAVDELNEEGGVLHRPIEAVIEDGKSDDTTFARAAEKLITEDKVVTLFGTWTSSSRKAVRPVVEKHRSLLVYPLQYEGLEESPNIVYLGATANQQVIPAVRYCAEKLGVKRFFLVGSDYVFPRAAAEIIRDEVKALGAEIVGEHYALLGATAFDPVAQRIKAARPDVILNLVNGDSIIALYRALRGVGVTPATTPIVTFSVTESGIEQLASAGIQVEGDYLAWTYFQVLETPENQAFIRRFRAKYGEQRVVSDPMAAAYAGVRMWANAVEAAGSVDTGAILGKMAGPKYAAPEGLIHIDPSTNHTWKFFRMGKIGPSGAVEIVSASDKAIEPVPFPLTRTRAQWETFLDRLSAGWKGGWANPQKPAQ